MATLGRVIVELRESRNWSQSKLSRMSDLSTPTVASIESGDGNPTVESLEKIASALDTTVPELYAMASKGDD